MNQILEQIGAIGLVPVVKLAEAEQAEPLARALCEGGLPCAEVTFRTPAAADAIRRMRAAQPQMLVGAGTVLTVEQADEAIAAGAAFVVSPGLNPRVVEHCLERDMPVLPGCATPSEVEQALALGLDTVKFFPAEAMGGLPVIRAMAAPYAGVRFMPTGGIGVRNLREYLACPQVLACGGSWMVKEALLDRGDFAEITRLTAEAVQVMLGFSVKHIGVNAADADDALRLAGLFGNALGLSVRQTPISVFSGDLVEVMSGGGRGTHGHIGVLCHDVARGRAYLEARGVAFDETTARYNAAGKLNFIYLAEEIGGFAIHLAGADS